MRNLGIRFWIESALAAVGAALLLLTLISRTWIEQLFGVDPDKGSGSLEWLIVAVTLGVTVTSVTLAAREWRRQVWATSASGPGR